MTNPSDECPECGAETWTPCEKTCSIGQERERRLYLEETERLRRARMKREAAKVAKYDETNK